MNKQKGWINEEKKKKKTHETRALLQLQCAHSAKTLDVQWYIYIYIRGKKVRTEDWKRKKRDKVANQNGTVDEQCKNTVEKRVQIDDWEKKKKDE